MLSIHPTVTATVSFYSFLPLVVPLPLFCVCVCNCVCVVVPQVLDAMSDSTTSSTTANDLDLIYLKGIMESPVV